MPTLSTASPFDLIERMERQLQSAEHLPAAEVHETEAGYEVIFELPGVDNAAIEVKATDRTLSIRAERRAQEPAGRELLSEFRYGTRSRSFRFAQPIDRTRLEAHVRDGLLTVKLPKARTHTTVRVQVES
jgi:HSP20 family protein